MRPTGISSSASSEPPQAISRENAAPGYSGAALRSNSAAALALIAAVVGGALVLAVGFAGGWLHGASTKTVVVRAPAPTAGDAAAPVVAAKPLLGNGFQPAQIYRAR